MGDDVTQEQAFAHANDVLKNAVGDISDIKGDDGHGSGRAAQPALRTGTDNLPILTQPDSLQGAQQAAPQRSYEGLNTPSVWRSARSLAGRASLPAFPFNAVTHPG